MNAKKANTGSLAAKLSDVGKQAFALAYLPKADRQPQLLLAPNIPKPLHEVAPRNVLGINWWNRERRACYVSTAFRCLACGVPKYCASYHQWLEAHETYSINYQLGRAVYTGAKPLCHLCHNSIHDGRLQALLDQGKIHHAKYVAVIQHRDKVLAEAGLYKPSLEERAKQLAGTRMAPWGEWRLVVNGVEYPPKYKSYQAWCKAHGYNEATGFDVEPLIEDGMEL